MDKFLSARITVTLPLVAVLAFGTMGAAQAAPGDLDGSFGAGGTVVTPISPGVSHELAYDVTLQKDGKIVAVGAALIPDNNAFLVTRYNADGSLDLTFNGDGKVTTGFGAGGSYAHAVVVQPDGKILVVGNADTAPSRNDFGLVRYNVDGSLDTTFDGDGIVTTDMGGYESAFDVALLPDGKIVVSGWVIGGYAGLVRYNTDGSLDTSFGDGGILITDLPREFGEDILIQPDGKIVLVTQNLPQGGVALVRFNADGSLDAPFGTNGKVVTTVGTRPAFSITRVVIQPNNKLVVATTTGINAGESGDHFTLIRYNTDGSLDASFGTDGIVATAITSGEHITTDIILQPNGKFIVFGLIYTGPETGHDFALARYHADGRLDGSFDNDGVVTTAIAPGAGLDLAVAGALQPDGKIVAFGIIETANAYAFGLARYGGDPTSNRAPVCTAVAPNISILATPNHVLQLITLNGATDPDGDALTLTITGVTQDEPVNGTGDGDTSPDAQSGPASNQVYVRGERSGKGDGRVYRIAYTVSDAKGGTCSSTSTGSGSVTISVPRSQNGSAAIDSGAVFNSFGL